MHRRFPLALLSAAVLMSAANFALQRDDTGIVLPGGGGGAAIRHDPRVRRPRRRRWFRRELPRDLWRSKHQAGRGHGNADAEQHDLAAPANPGRDSVALRLQDADSLSLRRRTDRLPRHRHGPAIKAARAAGADVIVEPFPDPIGRDAVIQWPGGVNTQIYWHTTPPSYAPFQAVPENRVYVSPLRSAAFVKSYLAFSHGKVVSDEPKAPGVEIGRAGDTFRRIRIESTFGKLTAFVTDGHLPYPYGREFTGYEVTNLNETLAKARGAGVTVLVEAYGSEDRSSAMVLFPGGYIAEIHSLTGK